MFNFLKTMNPFVKYSNYCLFIHRVELINLEMSQELWDKLYVAFSCEVVQTKKLIFRDISFNRNNMKQAAAISAKISNVIFDNIDVERKKENFWNCMLYSIDGGICGIDKLQLDFLQIYDEHILGLSKLITRIKQVELSNFQMDNGQWDMLMKELKKRGNYIQ